MHFNGQQHRTEFAAYTRDNIKRWLEEYPQFFETSDAERYVTWVNAKVDVLNAVNSLPRIQRQIFLLISVRQMTFYEASRALSITEKSAHRYWRCMVHDVVEALMDQTIHAPAESADYRRQSCSAAVSYEGRFDTPVKP